jgi:hypothetical protein
VTPRRLVGALGCVALLLAACKPEEKIVNYKPFFSGLEGAETQTPGVFEKPASKEPAAPSAKPGTASADGRTPEQVNEDAAKLQVTNPDGSITLISKNGLQLMRHIERCLGEGDARLFAEQVLSAETAREFRERGKDPREALAMLMPHQRDIGKLFSRLPLGEHSPNVILETVGRNVWRVRIDDQAAFAMRDRTTGTPAKYRGFDMVLENGNWRLRWFLEND